MLSNPHHRLPPQGPGSTGSFFPCTPSDKYVQRALLVPFPEDSINYAGKIISRMDEKRKSYVLCMAQVEAL